MRLRQILICSVATATVALISPAITPVIGIHSVAQADTNVSVSFNTFYDDLAPHGSWVSYRDSYVFVPARVSADWRPYTVGHWVYTKRYGWLWVSDEPFGWATYHYGRWGYAEDIGWYWVPGKRWAPAWVSWRRSADHVVWAPLPPGSDDDVSIEVNDIPDDYWVAVPSRNFVDVDLSVVIVDDDNERVRVVEAAEPVGNVVIENNVVVNNVIDVDYVEKTTEKKIETVEVKETDDPKQAGKESEGQIAAFTGEVQEEKDAKPAEVKDFDAVKKERAETQGTTPQGQTPDSQDQPSETEGQGQTQQPATPKGGEQKGTPEQPAQPEETQPQQGQEQPEQPEETQPQQQEQPTQKEKSTEQPAQPDEEQPQQEQEQPTQKKKAPEEPAQQEEMQPEQGQEQPTQKEEQAPEEPAQQEEMQPEQPQTEQAPEEPAQGKQPEQEGPAQEQPPAGGCDPASGQGC